MISPTFSNSSFSSWVQLSSSPKNTEEKKSCSSITLEPSVSIYINHCHFLYCKKFTQKMKMVCTKCAKVFYCSRRCLVKDRIYHRGECRKSEPIRRIRQDSQQRRRIQGERNKQSRMNKKQQRIFAKNRLRIQQPR